MVMALQQAADMQTLASAAAVAAGRPLQWAGPWPPPTGGEGQRESPGRQQGEGEGEGQEQALWEWVGLVSATSRLPWTYQLQRGVWWREGMGGG